MKQICLYASLVFYVFSNYTCFSNYAGNVLFGFISVYFFWTIVIMVVSTSVMRVRTYDCWRESIL